MTFKVVLGHRLHLFILTGTHISRIGQTNIIRITHLNEKNDESFETKTFETMQACLFSFYKHNLVYESGVTCQESYEYLMTCHHSFS